MNKQMNQLWEEWVASHTETTGTILYTLDHVQYSATVFISNRWKGKPVPSNKEILNFIYGKLRENRQLIPHIPVIPESSDGRELNRKFKGKK